MTYTPKNKGSVSFLVETFGKPNCSCRADEAAEVAAHAFRADDVRLGAILTRFSGKALMTDGGL